MTSLSVALSALRAQQQAMLVTSQNIANAGSSGYSAQRAILTANVLKSAGGTLYGGVTLASIGSLRDQVLDARVCTATSEQARLDALASVSTDIEALFGSIDGTNLQDLMEAAAAAFNDLAADPANDAIAAAAAGSLDTLCVLFNQIASGLDEVGQATAEKAGDAVSAVNRALSELAQLNIAVQRTTQANGSGEYADRQAQLLEELAGYLEIGTRVEADGSMQVTCGGMTLVSGGDAHPLQLLGGAASGIDIAFAGSGIRVDPGSGALAAYEQMVDQGIPACADELDALALGIIRYLGALQAAGSAGGEGSAVMTAETVFSSAQLAQDIDSVAYDAVHGYGFPAGLAPALPDSGTASVMRLVAYDAASGLSSGFVLTYDAGGGPVAASRTLQDLVDAINSGTGGGFSLVPPAAGALQASLVPADGGYRLRLETTDGRSLDIGSSLDLRPSDGAASTDWAAGNAGFALTGSYDGGAAYDAASPLTIQVVNGGTIGDDASSPTISVSVPVDTGGTVVMETTTYVLDSSLPAGVPIDIGHGMQLTFDDGDLAVATGAVQVAVDASDDRTGVLAALGLDGLLTGSGAADLRLCQDIADDPARIATGTSRASGESATASAMAAFTTAATAAGGTTPVGTAYQGLVADLGRAVSDAESLGETQTLVLGTLENQRQLLIGVDVDTQMATLIEQQQAYAAAAKVISMVRENNQTLLTILD